MKRDVVDRSRRRARRTSLRASAWLRRNSEYYLLEAAQAENARQLGRPPPLGPSGSAPWFWRRVYVPVYYRIPWRFRRVLMVRMPGSHRREWHQPPERRHPAV